MRMRGEKRVSPDGSDAPKKREHLVHFMVVRSDLSCSWIGFLGNWEKPMFQDFDALCCTVRTPSLLVADRPCRMPPRRRHLICCRLLTLRRTATCSVGWTQDRDCCEVPR
jgi:hypothetical protein